MIELLAVVIIHGLLLAISVPSITRYIAQSRKKVYLNTLDSYADGLSKMIANSEIPGMYDKDTTYYIPFKCIAIEKGRGSPNGDWDFAYVMTTNVSNNRKYYFYTKDVKKISVEAIEANSIKNSDVKSSELTIEDAPAISGTKKTHIVPESCDYNAALVKEMPFTPADSCFEIDATGTITAWNIEGTLTMEYGGYVYTPSQPNTCYVRNLSIPSTINGITVKTIGSPTSVENIKKSIFFCKKS